MVWFWATPIVYQYELVAGKRPELAWLYRLNPITPIVLTFQRAIYRETDPIGQNGVPIPVLPHGDQWWYLAQLLWVIVFSVALLAVGLVVFGRLEGNFAEEL